MSAHLRRLTALLLGVVFVGCGLLPKEDKTEYAHATGPMFDAQYYKDTAQGYYDTKEYGQARQIWQRQLDVDPNNWLARVAIAYCNVNLALESASGGDLKSARSLALDADKELHSLWNGTIEPDTATAPPEHPEWKAALGLAISARTLGYLDQVESNRATELSKQPGAEAAANRAKAAELTAQRDRNYAAAISLLKRLTSMEHASDDAIKDLGDLFVVTRQDALAEIEYQRYLAIADRSLKDWDGRRKQAVEATNLDEDDRAKSLKIIDGKVQSNKRKQVSVLLALADLTYARQSWLECKRLVERASILDGDQREVWLKLAQAEHKLQMYESAVNHIDEFLKRSTRKREDFDDSITVAMRLRKDCEVALATRKRG